MRTFFSPVIYTTRLSSNAVAGGPTPFTYLSNYTEANLANTVSLVDAIANNQWWVASSATALSLSSLVMQSGVANEVVGTYANGSGVGGPPQIYVLPTPAASASSSWQGRLCSIGVYPPSGPTHTGTIKAFTQLNYINFGTTNGYGVSYQYEFDATLATVAVGLIFYRLVGFSPTVLGTYGITPAIGSADLDRISVGLTIQTVGSDVTYSVEMRDENAGTPAWSTVISGTDIGSVVAGELLQPAVTHSLTGDSAEPVDGLYFNVYSNTDGDYAVGVTNQVGTL